MKNKNCNNLLEVSNIFTNECIDKFDGRIISIFFYGSSVTGDFMPKSDYDFVVLLREVKWDDIILVKTILENCSKVSLDCNKLEGGFHTVDMEKPWKDSLGIWIDKEMNVTMCQMYIEPDTVKAIFENGLRTYGKIAEDALPHVPDSVIIEFEKEYLLLFEKKINQRSKNTSRLYGALLNACRSYCYLKKKVSVTKTEAARFVANMFPEIESTIFKALEIRCICNQSDVDEKDIFNVMKIVKMLIKDGGLDENC